MGVVYIYLSQYTSKLALNLYSNLCLVIYDVQPAKIADSSIDIHSRYDPNQYIIDSRYIDAY